MLPARAATVMCRHSVRCLALVGLVVGLFARFGNSASAEELSPSWSSTVEAKAVEHFEFLTRSALLVANWEIGPRATPGGSAMTVKLHCGARAAMLGEPGAGRGVVDVCAGTTGQVVRSQSTRSRRESPCGSRSW